MGTIEKKSINNIILNYSTIVISVLASLFIYPMDLELYGLIQKLSASGLLLSAFLSFGSYALITKYYPFFDKNKMKGFFLLVLSISVAVSLIITVLYFSLIFINHIFEIKDLPYTFQELLYIYILGLVFSLFALFRSHAFNLKKLVFPDFLTAVTIKIFIPTLVFLSIVYSISKDFSVQILLCFYLLLVVTFVVYLKKIDTNLFSTQSLKDIKRDKLIEMLKYMTFSGLSHMGNIFAYKIDLIIIGAVLTDKHVGYYSTFLFLTTLIEIPTKSILQTAGPFISKYSELNELDKIKDLYTKTSINLFVVGTFVFGGVLINTNIAFLIMKNGEFFVPFQILILILGLAKLVDMVTSINTQIITFSKYYKYNTLFLVILATSNVILSYIFVKNYGIVGVGISTLFSVIIFNYLKSAFIFLKLKIHPFHKNHFYPLILVLISIVLTFIKIGSINILILNSLKTLLFFILFYFLIIRKNISIEVNKMFYKILPIK